MLKIDDLKVALDADAGLVRAIDGLSLIRAARPSRWWANPAAARA
jgi:ABC-type dipeptide/oligopeptide/nickel transport system ATPase component